MSSSTGKRGGRPSVRDSSGNLLPFLRGMVTHDLVQRGLSFDDAYAAARALRDRLSDREEISTTELRDLVDRQVEEMFGTERASALSPAGSKAPELLIKDGHRGTLPFSRGFLAQSLLAIGLDLDRSYRLVVEVQKELVEAKVKSLSSRELTRWVGDLLERWEGTEVAGRYRLMRRIRRLPRPLVIYVGGASGTGKSTLSLELAPLLRIYRINATDTIRQVMRMVFSSAILPSLHHSSFEQPPEAVTLSLLRHAVGDEKQEGDGGLIRSFEEQSTRVCVGVRAVVERAVAEHSNVMVEGVHLIPGLVPFADLGGMAEQLLIVLTTRDEEVHRAHLLARGPLGNRPGERYLDHLEAIRKLQEHLLRRADDEDVPLLDTSEELAVPRAVQLVADLLQQRLPWLALSAGAEEGVPAPVLLLVIDGLADRPVRALNGRTPLQAAETPNLDRLAREGRCGFADPVAKDVVPDTASGNLALFGQSPRAMQRGPIEALGAGLQLGAQDVALRANFAALDEEGRIADRRAGRIRRGAAELAAALDGMELTNGVGAQVRAHVRSTTEHRLAVVLRGRGLSSAIAGSDPGDAAPPGPPLVPRATDADDEDAVRTAALVAAFEEEARRRLSDHPVNRKRRKKGLTPANAVLTRGAGRVHRLRKLEPGGYPLRLACVSADRTVLGLAEMLGAESFVGPEMTANLDTDLRVKLSNALRALEDNDLVVVHFKGADIASHDMRPDLKVEFLERLDRELGWLLEQRSDVRIAVASDHATYSETGHHGPDPVPVLIWGPGIESDPVESFDEAAVATGSLGRFPLRVLVERLFSAEP